MQSAAVLFVSLFHPKFRTVFFVLSLGCVPFQFLRSFSWMYFTRERGQAREGQQTSTKQPRSIASPCILALKPIENRARFFPQIWSLEKKERRERKTYKKETTIILVPFFLVSLTISLLVCSLEMEELQNRAALVRFVSFHVFGRGRVGDRLKKGWRRNSVSMFFMPTI